ncbi:hypothetical protein DLM45_15690 [Hyphomicrobium methylovorum]|uniref:class I SAM-dependent methyltransferase n=1 Tax=Hyphomicrobium methylovorum TaxID=84 RepID=UPI0015E65825|nr:class I SAM-dependent methyltransferase [Hyphomicrobium methylovorum]MBA2127654.1 hypothetical protein [Hyphomicrobium methylovorum]
MSDFSAEWLDLREAADLRARSRTIADAVAGRFALRDEIRVLDLGSGTGANLRATAALLPKRQFWTLTDQSAALLDVAKARLARWADTSAPEGNGIRLTKNGSDITVSFATLDLAQGTEAMLAQGWDLVAASAFFDLVSEDYIRRLAKAIAEHRAAFYAALTYNGIRRWTPPRPTDNVLTAAFHRHQMRDKGFGPAAGPVAPVHLADQFRINGYTVFEDDSPWRLDRADRMLVDELVRGHAVAISETDGIDQATILSWVNVPHTAAHVGHTDTFAVPEL